MSPANHGVFELMKEVTSSAFCHSPKSSICSSFVHHSLTFSCLFQVCIDSHLFVMDNRLKDELFECLRGMKNGQ